ncbi:DUF723 domain-containing protein [Acinetobacter ursingii]|uniref:DUF723 domain-containing protein n=1 Tax=Acinetobacter ursingii TaxID=108980 RepID=UPI00029B4A2C|nr:DUF723 domain-containing protein [Acinetobacter ursingii]ENV76194.1 hypothetical protein F944_01665 [Acinetobacter ursingii DSM 16037 = CIP 107286]QQT67296.1 DUF723 domain-containing protein [Acinetobacter ursingii]
MAKYSREKVIEQFKNVHGDTYDYSLMEYLGDTTKVKIICRKHGLFEQWVQTHKKGSGCKQCALSSLKPKYTTEQIIEQFKKKHGDRFDYSKVNYRHALDKVIIICRIHGEFEQLAAMHRKGQGCAKCMYDNKRHLAQKVISKFKEKHGNRYDYSLVEYVNTDSKVKIICPDHGEFEQAPEKHIIGNGCPKCIGRHKTPQEVLSDFGNAHGDKYDYSKVIFSLLGKKVEIVCPEHGSFFQAPQKHIAGQACPKCGGSKKLTLLEYIAECTRIHENKYDYSQVIYKNGKSKIKIICPIHGEFTQNAFSHKSGCGCPYCAGNYTLETEEVIYQFGKVHGERYDYSKVNYTGAFNEVVIICKEHGEFTQTPKSHKKGSGCPECAVTIGHTKESYLEYCGKYEGKTHLYLIKCTNENEEFYKVGISRLGAKIRFDSKIKLPYYFEVIAEVFGDASLIWDLEKSIHTLMHKQKYKPKLEFHGKTECFSKIPKEIFEIFNNLKNSPEIGFTL